MDLNVPLIRASWEKMKPVSGPVADRFFQYLWNDFPESKAFGAGGDVASLGFAFFQVGTFIVDHLDHPSELEPYLKTLGEGLRARGAQDHHYGWLGMSLMKTLADFSGNGWTEVLAREWSNLYSMVSELLQTGRRVETVHLTAEHNAAAAAGLGTSPDAWMDRRSPVEEPAQIPHTEPALATVTALPDSVRTQIRAGVQDAVRDAIRKEVERVASEELDRFRARWDELFKKAG